MDDDKAFRVATAALLQDEGYSVRAAQSAAEGLQQVEAEALDRILTQLDDPQAFVGGLAHVLLPSAPPGRADHPERYALTSIPLLATRVTALGAAPSRLEATLSGGAAMFAALQPPGSIQTVERNVLAAREALREMGVAVRGEWVGGEFGRSVHFDLGTGVVTVSSVRHGTRQI